MNSEEIKDLLVNGEGTQVSRIQKYIEGHKKQTDMKATIFLFLMMSIFSGAWILYKPKVIIVQKCLINHDSLVIAKGDSIIFSRNAATNVVRAHFGKEPVE